MILTSLKERLRSAQHTFGGDILLGMATMATPAVGFMANFIGARYISPEQMGVFQTLLLIPAYCGFLQLGVFNGLSRNVPFNFGRGDLTQVQLMVNASWSVAKAISLFSLALCCVVIIYLALAGYPHLYLWAMGCVMCSMATDPFFSHADSIYRGVRQFAELGRKLFQINGIAIVSSMLPALAGIWGLLVGKSIQALIRMPVLLRSTPFRPTQPGQWLDIVDLARTGFPLLVAGTLYGYLGVSDRSVVAAMLTPADVGNLTLASLVVTSIQFAPVALTTLLYPRIAARYGYCGTSLGLRRYFWITLVLSLATVIPICVAAYFLIDPFTRNFLPMYIEGIAAAKVASLGSLGFLYFGVGAIIAVVRRNTLYIVAIVISLSIVWGAGAVLIAHGWGILGAAWARAGATAFLCLFTVGYAYWLTTQDIRC